MKKLYTGGTFDLFHRGHVNFLKMCKEIADYVVVSLNTDEFIYEYKGKYPILDYKHRRDVLLGCKYVDEVIVYHTEDDLLNLLKTQHIDIRFLGDEYKWKDFTGKQWCLDQGIELFYHERQHPYSSSSLRQRVWQAEQDRMEKIR